MNRQAPNDRRLRSRGRAPGRQGVQEAAGGGLEEEPREGGRPTAGVGSGREVPTAPHGSGGEAGEICLRVCPGGHVGVSVNSGFYKQVLVW